MLVMLGSVLNAQESKIVSLPKFISKSIQVFTKYVNWPMNCKSGDFKIAIIGDKAVYNELSSSIVGTTVGAQNVVVNYYAKVDEIQGFNHMIFISESNSGALHKLIGKIGTDNTLVVSAKEGLIQSGSGINFVPVDGLMKFEISKANINRRNLEVHSWLEKMGIKEG